MSTMTRVCPYCGDTTPHTTVHAFLAGEQLHYLGFDDLARVARCRVRTHGLRYLEIRDSEGAVLARPIMSENKALGFLAHVRDGLACEGEI